MSRGRPDEALRQYEKAAALRPSAFHSYAIGTAREALKQVDSADAAYRDALAQQADHLESRVNLGSLLRKRGMVEEALHHHLVAYGLASNNPVVVYNLGMTVTRSGMVQAGRHLLERTLQLNPKFNLAKSALKAIPTNPHRSLSAPSNWTNSPAQELVESGDDEAAAAEFTRGLEEHPDSVPSLTDFGACLLRLGRVGEAEDAELHALSLSPDFAPAWHNLGAVRQGTDAAKARDAFIHAIVYQPGLLQSWISLGQVSRESQPGSHAFDLLLVASRLDGAGQDVFSNLVLTSCGLGRFGVAEAALKHMAQVWPDGYLTHLSTGLYLSARGDNVGSLKSLKAALSIDPDAALALANKGAALHLLDCLEEAYVAYTAAWRELPHAADLLTRCIHIGQYIWRWENFPDLLAGVKDAITSAEIVRAQPFSLIAIPGVDAATQLAVNKAFVARGFGHIQPLSGSLTARHNTGRLRVGYASSDYYSHATSCLISELIEVHDRSRFEIIGYNYGAVDGDHATSRLRSAFDTMVDIGSLSDRDAARRIRHDDVDVLIDLKGHTRGCRTGIFAYRPSAIQVNYLGFPGSSGAPFMDYVIADAVIVPAGTEDHFSERVLRLPRCYQPNDRKRPLPPKPARAHVGLPENKVVLCSFNNAFKLTPAVLDLWCKVLRETTDTVLWQLSAGSVPDDRLRSEIQRRGVDPGRLVFAPRTDYAKHLARVRCADLFLDTFPCGAHTTASDALWCGVPLITMIGETFASRVAASILTTAGMSELVVDDGEAYVQGVLGLARDPDRLSDLKHRLEVGRSTSPLFDTDAFARDLEDLLLGAVEDSRQRSVAADDARPPKSPLQ